MNYLTLPVGAHAPEVVNAVVEVPSGQVNKYEYDKSLHVFRLDRPLFASVHYPCEYGFIPSTLGGDGDALDILILTGQPSFPGCLVEARPVGVLDMLDQGVSDKKILAVIANNPEHREIQNYTDVYPHLLHEMEHFFSIYKELEGKRTEVKGWRDRTHAQQVINESHQRFKENQR
ncbi:MAG: Inorganic diphosphatase [Pedosphaera sp.]|nr:Inorganic diphosphatase [Pedosphaera sp.]